MITARTPHPSCSHPQSGRITKIVIFPEKLRDLELPHQVTPTLRYAQEKPIPKTPTSENQWGICPGKL